MRVEDFYGSACKTKAKLLSLVDGKSRNFVLRRAVMAMCEMYANGQKEDEIGQTLWSMLEKEYEPSWFALDWQKDQQARDDLACMMRFIRWLDHAPCLDANVRTSIGTKEGVLTSRADLIVQRKDGTPCAMTIHFKKADKSLGGKSACTSTGKDLYMLVNKAALEERYPGLHTGLIYLVNEEDGAGSVGAFKTLPTKKSNAFIEEWRGLYEGGVFMRHTALALIEDALTKRPKPDCFTCGMKDLCRKDTVKDSLEMPAPVTGQDRKAYEMPEFTKRQEEVISFKDGPMLVCAGPGSGKTATLVGRMRRLIETGVEPELILAITFTREAASELLRRCMSFCRPDEHPEIMTLNALGYKIIRDNEELVGKKVCLMTQLERYNLIKRLLSDYPMMAGFQYTAVNGKRGLIATLDMRIAEYRHDPEAYMARHPECDDAFRRFAGLFTDAVEAGGYIGFDEQITLALKLLEECPEAMEGLSRRYAYIMVDEYQDVNEDQKKMVYALAHHRNLVVVGDDDQSIYGFRGGSNRYMLSFTQDFKEAKKVVLKENFRSTEALVNESQAFISGNRNRIYKAITPVRKGGREPVVMKGRNPENLERCVSELKAMGFSLSDIAVLASKNATLEELSREVTFSHVLGKAYLRDSAVFKVILNILVTAYGGVSEKNVLTLLSLMDAMPPEGETVGSLIALDPDLNGDGRSYATCGTARSALGMIGTAVRRVKSGCAPAYLVDHVCQELGVEETAAYEAMSQLIEKAHIRSCRELVEHMQSMSDFEDDTRIEPDLSDAVLFITSHESKGMEWKAVIMCDDYRDDRSEETNRLWYVAMTRAKDMLYVLTEREGTLLNNKTERRVA